jgi:hypothetical protein
MAVTSNVAKWRFIEGFWVEITWIKILLGFGDALLRLIRRIAEKG